ncbi:acyltransferase domain-containing protein [Streptomyces sp. PLK6-54]|uniref:Acyltransferase domain-containing protein n=1 Tax=Actinacidiphila acidipaludis TaxID=2873382 RepID=A0ABS7QCC3_9ACTN|nr:acyltransferase domain-containing protein [Streptomyces acidipaludis]
MPRGRVLAETLVDLGVPYAEINGVLAAAERLARDEEAAALLSGAVRDFVRDMGVVGGGPEGGPQLGPDLDALPSPDRWFTLLVLAATRPHTVAYHRSIGVPEEISRRTLADVGRHLAVHQRRHGTPGLANTRWLARHFRGVLYQLGRLQFERVLLGGRSGRLLADAGVAEGPGTLVLNVHVPDFTGPLDPGECDASFDRARAFFPRHFPGETHAVAICHSWLLDPQLAVHLPPDSRILAFQRRFTLVYPTPSHPAAEPDDASVLGFVFGDPEADPAGLTPRTSIQRVVLAHLSAGHHWTGGTAWRPL